MTLELVRRYLAALDADDHDAAEELVDPGAEFVFPDQTTLDRATFFEGMRGGPGLDHLDVAIADRDLQEQDGAVVSHVRRVFRWKESGEEAYAQPAESRFLVKGGKIVRAEIVR